jgi:hypothetical protein
MMHEISHVVQFKTYLSRTREIPGVEALGISAMTDDVVQDMFATESEFVTSFEQETRLLFAAAAAGSNAECRDLARTARTLMLARQTRYYGGQLQALLQLENIFLTLEGSGQFAAVLWLTSTSGPRLSREEAEQEFGREGRYWSQRQGLALFLVLERLAPEWRRTVYGHGRLTALELLDQALQ